MKRDDVFAIVMAGGRGERFWPQSRASHPKQLLRLIGNLTLIEQTVERLTPLVEPDNIIVITNQDYVAPMQSLLSSLAPENIVGEPVGDLDRQLSGIALVAVRADERQLHSGFTVVFYRGCLPHGLVKTLDAAVQVVGAVVGRQPILDPVQLERRLGDSVGVPAGDRSEEGMPGEVVSQSVEAEGHVFEVAVAVGHSDRRQRSAVGHHRRAEPVGVGQGVFVYRRSVRDRKSVV